MHTVLLNVVTQRVTMVRLLPIIASQFIICTLLSSFAILQISGDNHEFVKTMDPKAIGLKQQKLTHFHFYFHDIYTGSNPTVVPVVNAVSNTSATLFGSISMMDDPLTEGPESNSKLIARAQGFYGSASQDVPGLIMVMNFVFLEGKYNGSTIAVLGRNKALEKEREMPIVGGSGLFRFARGYTKARTYFFNATTGDAVVEYDVYALHY